MLRLVKTLFFTALFVCCAPVLHAQLPASPWTPQAPKPNSGYFGAGIADAAGSDITDSPIYAGNAGGGEILPVDPWARARDRSGVRTWRGSGQHGKLNYIGEGTIFNTGDMEMLAPEVNRHNMVVILDHLRKMGYHIPQSYNQKIQNMPSAYKEKLRESVTNVGVADDPFSKSFVSMLGAIENQTGLDFGNILFNTMDILGTD